MDNGAAGKCAMTAYQVHPATCPPRGSQQQDPCTEEAAMPIEIDAATQRCTLIADDLNIEGEAGEVTIVTDESLRMSVATLAGQRVPITEQEADALTVAGAVDGRRHLKTTEEGSII